MKSTIQFSIRRGESQYVAECLELPIVTQAPSLDRLAANISEAVALFVHGEDPAEFGLAASPVVLATLELEGTA